MIEAADPALLAGPEGDNSVAADAAGRAAREDERGGRVGPCLAAVVGPPGEEADITAGVFPFADRANIHGGHDGPARVFGVHGDVRLPTVVARLGVGVREGNGPDRGYICGGRG